MIQPRAVLKEKQFAAKVAEVERQLKDRAVRVRYSLGEDWSGEPAVFFRIVLPDRLAQRNVLLGTATAIRNSIEEYLQPAGRWGVHPYFDFRSESEDAQLKEPAWA